MMEEPTEQETINSFIIPPPRGERGKLPPETDAKAFKKVREELNETLFKRPPVVQEHWMQRRNCQCKDCKEYFEEE